MNAMDARRHALVVEDEGMTALFLRHVLLAAGYPDVSIVGDGVSAVEAALSRRPDLILMDVKLPGMSGIEATRRITAASLVPVVILTAYGEEALVEEAIVSGACAYLVKPVVQAQIVPAIRTAMARFDVFESIYQENQDLKDNLETRKIVERAKGILIQRLQLSEADAFRRLQRSARDRSQTMKQVSRDVIQADELLGDAGRTTSPAIQ